MRWGGLLLLFLIGCTEVTPRAARTDAILGGAADPAATTTFLLDLRFNTGSASICSAVLISPKVLLTAAHCVDPVFHSAATMTVRATNKADIVGLMNSDMIDVTLISRHPSWNPSDQTSNFDIAVLLLARAPSGVTPVSLLRAMPGNAVGQSVTVLGYGRTSAGDGASSGTRRSVVTPITAMTTADFTFGTSGGIGICAGDSGGASLLGGAVAGIHSRTESTSCGTGVDMRVDQHLSFIDTFIATNDPPPCAADGVCSAGCGQTDPDCRCIADGTCDMSCSADPDCRCRADGTCDATCGGTDPDCRCMADGTCDTTCTADPDCTCRANGTCDASCGATDPDCCAADGTCDATCGTSDPDCRCGANSVCDASCGGSDVDCCTADGTCRPTCAADPDCRCPADGACDWACGLSDPDCLDDGQVCTDPSVCGGAQCLSDPRGFKFCSRTCADTVECQNGMTCQGGLCRAAPMMTGGDVKGGCATAPGVLVLGLLALVRRRR